VLIRPATSADIPSILALERASPPAAHWSEAEYHHIFESNEPRRLALIFERQGVRAFLVARTTTPEWELENIVVAEDNRRQSLATMLVRELQQHARTEGAHAIFLEVRQSNTAARALYHGCGFEITGRRFGYYRCPEEDAIIYTCCIK
jgi:ribosomal-protein-alanine N-acetyltransferase